MKIVIVAPESINPTIEQSFSNRGCVGISFEYCSDVMSVFDKISMRGFYMDKLVILTAVLSEWDDVQRQDLVDKVVTVCDALDETGEIYIFDSAKIMATDYANSLSFYGQVIYQDQKVRVADLLGIIIGDYIEPVAENINQEVKPKGFFSRLRRGKQHKAPGTQVVQEQKPASTSVPIQEPESEQMFPPQLEDEQPLFEDAENSSEPVEQDDEFDLDNLDIQMNSVQPIAQITEPVIDDTPLFEEPEEQEPEPEPMPEITPVPTPKLTKTKASKNLPVPKQEKAPKPSHKSDYLGVFQKRTKIILCTGERRSGNSTFMSNIAQVMQRDGLSCLVVDLDFERRGQAINFPFDHDPDDVRLTYSLYNAIKSTTGIDEHAIQLDEGLDFLGTSMYVADPQIMYDHVTNDALQRLLATALSEYDVILVDCPFERLKLYTSLVGMASIVVHSVLTDIRSVYNTLNALTESDFASVTDYNLYLSKMMLLLNCYTAHKWNGAEITEKYLPQVMYGLTDSQMYLNFAVVGRIPYFPDYDTYMDGGKLLVDNKKYRDYFVQILNELAIRG